MAKKSWRGSGGKGERVGGGGGERSERGAGGFFQYEGIAEKCVHATQLAAAAAEPSKAEQRNKQVGIVRFVRQKTATTKTQR